jgi:hypothetical protein
LRATLKSDTDIVWSVAFTPDGKILASAEGPDTVIRLWDLSTLMGGKPSRTPRLSNVELQELWADLAAADAARAYRAMATLTAAAPHFVPWLGERLRPVASASPQRVDQLIADLNSDDFAAREAAAQALEDLGESAGPALRRVSINRPQPETQRRVQRLLDRLRQPACSPERLRVLRAIEVLERTGSTSAQQILQKLAGGLPGARVTEEAQQSLTRLVQRASPAGNR